MFKIKHSSLSLSFAKYLMIHIKLHKIAIIESLKKGWISYLKSFDKNLDSIISNQICFCDLILYYFKQTQNILNCKVNLKTRNYNKT